MVNRTSYSKPGTSWCIGRWVAHNIARLLTIKTKKCPQAIFGNVCKQPFLVYDMHDFVCEIHFLSLQIALLKQTSKQAD
jgi:hypothetical protein